VETAPAFITALAPSATATKTGLVKDAPGLKTNSKKYRKYG